MPSTNKNVINFNEEDYYRFQLRVSFHLFSNYRRKLKPLQNLATVITNMIGLLCIMLLLYCMYGSYVQGNIVFGVLELDANNSIELNFIFYAVLFLLFACGLSTIAHSKKSPLLYLPIIAYFVSFIAPIS